jgi:hypothetical protein
LEEHVGLAGRERRAGTGLETGGRRSPGTSCTTHVGANGQHRRPSRPSPELKLPVYAQSFDPHTSELQRCRRILAFPSLVSYAYGACPIRQRCTGMLTSTPNTGSLLPPPDEWLAGSDLFDGWVTSCLFFPSDSSFLAFRRPPSGHLAGEAAATVS